MRKNCYFCDGDRYEKLLEVEEGKEKFWLGECLRCRIVTTLPRVGKRELYGRYYEAYRSNSSGQRFWNVLDGLMKWWRRRRVETMERLMGDGAVLDVGCGQASELVCLQMKGKRTYGLEYSSGYAAELERKTGVKMYCGDLRKLPLKRESLNLVCYFHSLEHITEAKEWLAQTRRVLKEGGYLIIAVPDFLSLEAKFFGKHWFHLDVPRHVHHFNREWLKNYLKKLGFAYIQEKKVAPEYDYYSCLQGLLNMASGSNRNWLYKLFFKEQQMRRKDYLYALTQVPFVLGAGIAAVPIMLWWWLTGGAGTVELVMRKVK